MYSDVLDEFTSQFQNFNGWRLGKDKLFMSLNISFHKTTIFSRPVYAQFSSLKDAFYLSLHWVFINLIEGKLLSKQVVASPE